MDDGQEKQIVLAEEQNIYEVEKADKDGKNWYVYINDELCKTC